MQVKQISREELAQWQKDGKQFRLVDVREKHEHLDYNIGGELIPLSELNRQFRPSDSDIPIIFYCRKGIRSQIAIQRLQQKYPQLEFYNLTSGLTVA